MSTAPAATMMLVSREKNRYTPINAGKVQRGAFLTVHAQWLLPQVARFIRDSGTDVAVDPFAGDWDMLKQTRDVLGIEKLVGYDIDPRNKSQWNDSMIRIPTTENGIIVTNPPYLANHSAKRKRVWNVVSRYFDQSTRTDLYQIALDRCLESFGHVVAIIPETFICSNYPMHRLAHASVIEDALFDDTQCPICIACFSPKEIPRSRKIIYRSKEHVCTFGELDRVILSPNHSIPFTFNDPKGNIALRAVDLTDPEKPIQFLQRHDIAYEEQHVKESSRLVTFISSPHISKEDSERLIRHANALLLAYRAQCGGIHLSPFKGNARDGRRRRRLDYKAARAILEQAAGDLRLCARAQRLLP